MDQREIRLGCLKLAAAMAPKESSPFTLKQAALDLERFVMAEGTADEVGKAMVEKRLAEEQRSLEARRHMEAMLNGRSSGEAVRKFGDLY